jgi:hypothetical protein
LEEPSVPLPPEVEVFGKHLRMASEASPFQPTLPELDVARRSAGVASNREMEMLAFPDWVRRRMAGD